MSTNVKYWTAMAAVFAALIAALWAIHAWQDDRCQAKGGHLVAADRSWICVSSDGRVIE